MEFQLTRSRGAWLSLSRIIEDKSYFNSHAHVERDRIFTYFTDIDFNFNSHAHVERDKIGKDL